ncbi:MAG: hypothetical protein ABR549_11925 [Mycobacteriales bacterium]
MVLLVLVGWAVLSILGVMGAAAVCRAGHAEDVARGFAEPPDVPEPRGLATSEVTHR